MDSTIAEIISKANAIDDNLKAGVNTNDVTCVQ
jgi:hypothetical protein